MPLILKTCLRTDSHMPQRQDHHLQTGAICAYAPNRAHCKVTTDRKHALSGKQASDTTHAMPLARSAATPFVRRAGRGVLQRAPATTCFSLTTAAGMAPEFGLTRFRVGSCESPAWAQLWRALWVPARAELGCVRLLWWWLDCATQ